MARFYQVPTDPEAFIETINLRHPAWQAFFAKEHRSTQILAKEAFHDGLDCHAIFIARNQTSGRGRQERGWISSPDGKDLTMSLLIPLPMLLDKPALLNLIGGISVVEALTDLTKHQFKVKWPNDIFHASSKIGGIISELLISSSAIAVAMGIGINVNSRKEFFSGITSFYDINTVSSIIGKKLDLASLIIGIIDRLQSNLPLLDESLISRLFMKWEILGMEYGRRIRYREIGGEWVESVSGGLTSEGYLAIVDDKGDFIKALIEGDVVLLE